MNIKFPTRRSDGSFPIHIEFSFGEDGIVTLVRSYVAAWVRANARWVRIWRSDTIKEEILEFSRDFSSDPQVEASEEPNRFVVTLEGRAGSAHWKEWAALLVQDIGKLFPEVTFIRFVS